MHYLVILAFNLSMIFGYSVHFEVDMTDLEFPNADYIMRNGLLIGCHQGLTKIHINYIHNVILKALKSNY